MAGRRSSKSLLQGYYLAAIQVLAKRVPLLELGLCEDGRDECSSARYGAVCCFNTWKMCVVSHRLGLPGRRRFTFGARALAASKGMTFARLVISRAVFLTLARPLLPHERGVARLERTERIP